MSENAVQHEGFVPIGPDGLNAAALPAGFLGGGDPQFTLTVAANRGELVVDPGRAVRVRGVRPE